MCVRFNFLIAAGDDRLVRGVLSQWYGIDAVPRRVALDGDLDSEDPTHAFGGDHLRGIASGGDPAVRQHHDVIGVQQGEIRIVDDGEHRCSPLASRCAVRRNAC